MSEGYTLDASEQVRRIAELKKKLLEAVDFCTTWEEQEEKKRSASETEFQTD
jgi:hypothetical protein